MNKLFVLMMALVASAGLAACSHNPTPQLTRAMVTPVLIQDLNPVYDMGTVRSTRDDVFLCGEVRAFRPQTAEKKGVVIFTDGSAHALDGVIETKIELGATYVFRVANTPHPENGYRVLETTPMKSCGETIKK